jgi:hypothetical protein
VIDEHGRTEYLSVTTAHRRDCTFGPGFFRLCFGNQARYCQDQAEVQRALSLLDRVVSNIRVERDGHCLDGDVGGDANTPDVLDGDWWLSLPVSEGMRELGLTSEIDYRRAYTAIEAAVYRRDNRATQGGVRASVIIKRPGARVTNVHV